MPSEPYVPVPSPDPDGYRDPTPPLCPECGVILQNLRPGADNEWQGWCPEHGLVPPTYRDDFSELRIEEEEQS